MTESDLWQSPWADRYASKQLLELFGQRSRTYHWRLMWLYLAKAQHTLGLPVTAEQVADLEHHLESIDFIAIRDYELRFKHDVMAHVHAFGDKATIAKPILHLGATSADITDNADMMMFRKALQMIEIDLVMLLHQMKQFAHKHKEIITLGFTHFQSATATTVGKRTTLWMQSLLQDLEDVIDLIQALPLKGFKGATGTAESYHNLFNGDYEQYLKMEQLIAGYAKFEKVQAVSGQTYDRKWDVKILSTLSNIAVSAHKMTNDLRLLQHLKEFEEPFGESQIGSSAMAYKRNPMKAERVSSLAKWVMSLYQGAVTTATTQWFERTLDDSAIRRLNIPQAFFGVNAILRLLQGIMADARVYDRVIAMHLEQELPLLLTEKIMMAMVQAGGDRQEAHEIIRQATHKMTLSLKVEGKQISLVDLLAQDPRCQLSRTELETILSHQDVAGFAVKQTEAFLRQVEQSLAGYQQVLEQTDIPDLEV
ncbi:adenylosuccinate lyase [Entomospira entomophila]|uniref:Adenylosuccinate lyase n=1 Tax=Entomospira entomophila TaxID=2719988 RepID=A0A968G8Z8_9SPIO|nr:adenylosuccinate lyase [Entomospira entomophilus]NIZ40788.1 adenylosuccinate lyase [Entomospira entomophilus]WDI35001.1 adenylosuccinate lyase [Entomospira entomophilus]